MIGYLNIFRNTKHYWVPRIGIKYRNNGWFIFTQFKNLDIYTPNRDVYKVEFTPDGPEIFVLMGRGYKPKGYTVLELV